MAISGVTYIGINRAITTQTILKTTKIKKRFLRILRIRTPNPLKGALEILFFAVFFVVIEYVSPL